MANVQSAEKRNRQRLKRRQRNLSQLTTTRTLVKRAASASNVGKDIPASAAAVKTAVRQLDRAAQKGIIKRQTASRKISRLTKALARLKANPPSGKTPVKG